MEVIFNTNPVNLDRLEAKKGGVACYKSVKGSFLQTQAAKNLLKQEVIIVGKDFGIR